MCWQSAALTTSRPQAGAQDEAAHMRGFPSVFPFIIYCKTSHAALSFHKKHNTFARYIPCRNLRQGEKTRRQVTIDKIV